MNSIALRENDRCSDPQTKPIAIDHRMPPYSLEAEESVLGAMFQDWNLIDELLRVLKPTDFFRDAHQILCRAIYDLRNRGEAIDSITVQEFLIRSGELDRIGGLNAILSIRDSVPHAANGRYHGQIILELSMTRDLIEASNQTLFDAFARQYPAEDLVEDAERRIFAISDSRFVHETATAVEAVDASIEAIKTRQNGQFSGIDAGLLDFDAMLGGFQKHQLIIIGARPSMGKTAFALQIANHAAGYQGLPILFASLEMGREEIGGRMIQLRTGISGEKLRRADLLSHADLARIHHEREQITGIAPIIIDDSPSLNVTQIAAQARRVKSRHGLGMVVIDYLQLVDSPESRDSRQEQISKISRRLKTLARDLGLPVVALSQLNRAVEAREDKRPRMADLRESGAIEQDADVVVLLHRPEYYDPNDQPGIAELIIAKNRSGSTGNIKVQFEKSITKFRDLAIYPSFDSECEF